MMDGSSQMVQNSDWLKELQLVREEAKIEHSKKQAERKPNVVKLKSTSDLLKRVNGLELLRDIQKEVLNGQGLIEQLDDTDKYERALALMWDSSIAAPTRPKDMKQAQNCILIGIANSQLFVNENLVSPATPQTLQRSLLQVLRNSDKPQEAEPKSEQKDKQSERTFSRLKWVIIFGLLFINITLVALGIILLMNAGVLTFSVW